MPPSRLQEPPGFRSLTKAEQVRYLQDLWDQISLSPGDLPAPDSHLEVAEARLRLHREDPTSAECAFGMLDRLAGGKK